MNKHKYNKDNYLNYYDNIEDSTHRDYVKSVIINKYGYIEYNGSLYTKEEYTTILEENADFDNVMKMINNNENIHVFFIFKQKFIL